MADFCTVLAVQADLGLPASADSTLLQAWVTGASGWMEAYLQQPVLTTTHTLVLDGRGGNAMFLPFLPVQSVSLVKVDTTTYSAATAGGTDTGYFIERRLGALRLRGATFARGTGNVQVTYVSGYTTVPYGLERACVRLVAWRYRERDRIGQQSKSIGGETVSYQIAAAATDVLKILDSYRRVVPA